DEFVRRMAAIEEEGEEEQEEMEVEEDDGAGDNEPVYQGTGMVREGDGQRGVESSETVELIDDDDEDPESEDNDSLIRDVPEPKKPQGVYEMSGALPSG
ncbi:MAG: hypothetical protein Q9196_005653, partial [Gyalolechia fulgens]